MSVEVLELDGFLEVKTNFITTNAAALYTPPPGLRLSSEFKLWTFAVHHSQRFR